MVKVHRRLPSATFRNYPFGAEMSRVSEPLPRVLSLVNQTATADYLVHVAFSGFSGSNDLGYMRPPIVLLVSL